jgi:hypothetical protein
MATNDLSKNNLENNLENNPPHFKRVLVTTDATTPTAQQLV